MFEGDQWQACMVLQAGIEKAGSIEAAKLRAALERVEIDSIKGQVVDARLRPSGASSRASWSRWCKATAWHIRCRR